MVDVAPVPDRLENSVGKAEGENILDRLLSQVVIDAVNLLFAYCLEKFLVQGARGIQVAAEWFFDDYSSPLVIFLAHQAGGGELLHDGAKEIRGGGEIVEIITVSSVSLSTVWSSSFNC